jgi:hypothetical protein
MLQTISRWLQLGMDSDAAELYFGFSMRFVPKRGAAIAIAVTRCAPTLHPAHLTTVAEYKNSSSAGS